MVKFEDILFWILIALVISVAIWKLVGSPTDTATLISVSLFVVGSEILLWKALFNIDKKMAAGFMKTRNEFDNMRNELNGNINNIDKKLEKIENLVRRKR